MTTTASFSGLIEVCIDYSGIIFPGEESELRLFHFEDPDWIDRTDLPVNTADDIICATVSSLSEFAIFAPVVDPVVSPITAPLDPGPVGTIVNVQATYTDGDDADSHAAEWDWGDGSTSACPPDTSECAIDQATNTVTGAHAYGTPGVYTVVLTITDGAGGVGTSSFEFVVVFDPDGGFVTGGGWIDSPPGASGFGGSGPEATGKAKFGFVSKYKRGATVPTGKTEFQFKAANLSFRSDVYEWLVVAGPHAKFKGTGTINGGGNYGFMVTATDGQISGGGGVDGFRIKIWDKNNNDTVVYDNKIGESDDSNETTVLGGGSIVIHKQ